MRKKTITVRITKEEMWALGFEKVEAGGKTYVDVTPCIWQDGNELKARLYQYACKKAKEGKKK